MSYPHWITYTEKMIIDQIIEEALVRNYKISVFDGEEWSLNRSRNADKVRSEVAATDTTTLRFRDLSDNVIGQVWLIHGNEYDVIADHSDNTDMEELLAKANAVAETFQ